MPGLEQIREGEVPAALAGTYRDIRHALRIGYVPLLLRALAPVPGALRAAWVALRPNVATRAFEEAGDDLRAELARAAVDLGTPLIEPLLAANGSDVDEVDELREQVQLFHYADPKLLLVVAALSRALSGERVGGARVARELLAPPPEPDDLPALVLAPEAPGGVVGEVFAEILRTTHLPAVTTDLRALGHWPVVLETAWEALAPVFGHPKLEAALAAIRASARARVQGLPYPMAFGPEAFGTAAGRAHVQRVVATFDDALPRLALFASALRVSLDGPEDALASPFAVEWAPAEPEPPPP